MSLDTTRLVLARAARHGGVITLADSRSLAIGDKKMAGLVRAGVLRRPFPGVFTLAGGDHDHDHVLDLRAALAAVGRGAMASHRSAAWLLELVDRPPPRPVVTVTGAWRSVVQGVEVHTSASVPEWRRANGVRCTAPARTLVDLAAVGLPSEVDDAVDRALAKGLVRLDDLEGALPSHRRGVGRLRTSLTARGHLGGPTPSVLESRMARLLLRAGLPVPKAEVRAGEDGRYRIDFAYPHIRLGMECAGYAWHHRPGQMRQDLERQRRLTLEGWTILVFTWQDVVHHPERVAQEILAAYRSRAAAVAG